MSTLNNQRGEVACPLCGCYDYQVMFLPTTVVNEPKKLYGAASGIRNTQRIVRCNKCPMIYENPRLSEALILEGYCSSDDAGHDSQFAFRKLSFSNSLKNLAPNLPAKGAKILDIGTAGGAFLEAAAEFGYDAYGIEPSHSLVVNAQKRGLKVEQGTIRKNSYAANSFDMICMWDVLEHLAEPKLDLEALHPLLKHGGTLLINFPDIGTPMAKLSGSKFWWLLSVHLTHFNRASIREICKRSGFSVTMFKPYWQTLQFGYLIDIAIHLGVPLASVLKRLTPRFVQRFPMPYYASQTTCLAKKE